MKKLSISILSLGLLSSVAFAQGMMHNHSMNNMNMHKNMTKDDCVKMYNKFMNKSAKNTIKKTNYDKLLEDLAPEKYSG
ncbi:hypothetical protein CRU98_11140 [Arcobacter sp. CECT 8986]|uniref:hypothetical protein n=1 Tax=Arcobacter sp. CECT 8986 TaxID=2044507 RepID=UPI001009E4E1|nr:hypothetical protein [Arcobacter sp. CECT 8986]RXJ98066.1 hypothetical protein CRU98_11140 [Arcobacter sp. CECT 8986]